ncbi:MAG: radical SAM protein, partial [Ruminococcus sp.]|nr:radical SAM protein [Ruminococcus sp.]
MKPIYEPKGKAKEYGDLAINIYTGCPHRCFYCFAPNVLHKQREEFHTHVEPRQNIVEEVRKQVAKENITGKLIHLCFACDPYPKGYDSTPTREIIKILKAAGNHVQVLTKNGADAMRDFDLLDENDWFGITYAGYSGLDYMKDYIPDEEPNAGSPHDRLYALAVAHNKGIKTWVSAEPVLNTREVIDLIESANYVNSWKIGKLNYYPSETDWGSFGAEVEHILTAKKRYCPDVDYYIKDSLRAEIDNRK